MTAMLKLLMEQIDQLATIRFVQSVKVEQGTEVEERSHLKGKVHWPAFGKHGKLNETFYNLNFENSLGSSVEQTLFDKLMQKGELSILDLAAPAQSLIIPFLKYCGHFSHYVKGTAVTLTQPPKSQSIPKMFTNNVSEVYGDLNLRSTTQKVFQAMGRTNIKGYDFIFINPLGGYDFTLNSPALDFLVAWQYWNILNCEGEMITRLRLSYDTTDASINTASFQPLYRWVEMLSASSIPVIFDPKNLVLIIKREANSPQYLPSIKDFEV